MHAPVLTRDYADVDRAGVDALVRAAWQEMAAVLPGWDALSARLGVLTEKSGDSEVIVAEADGQLLGAVGYVGAQQSRPDFFEAGWPIVRFMSVLPAARGRGVGRLLLDDCIARARRDRAPCLALHTSTLMASAGRLYREAGFAVLRPLPDMYGAPFVLMIKPL
ncbi:MAG: GNAT family N-acetyltransferase [Massilia sp.]